MHPMRFDRGPIVGVHPADVAFVAFVRTTPIGGVNCARPPARTRGVQLLPGLLLMSGVQDWMRLKRVIVVGSWWSAVSER